MDDDELVNKTRGKKKKLFTDVRSKIFCAKLFDFPESTNSIKTATSIVASAARLQASTLVPRAEMCLLLLDLNLSVVDEADGKSERTWTDVAEWQRVREIRLDVEEWMMMNL